MPQKAHVGFLSPLPRNRFGVIFQLLCKIAKFHNIPLLKKVLTDEPFQHYGGSLVLVHNVRLFFSFQELYMKLYILLGLLKFSASLWFYLEIL